MGTHEADKPTSGQSTDRAEAASRYLRYMADYVGFTKADADVIRSTKPIIRKHLPTIISQFYAHLLRYPVTRSLFLLEDGTIDVAYLQLRMRHLSNFWLRTADGLFDDEYAAYLDYVGRAHTSHGADPNIYIPERYVIGQVGMIQHAISRALSDELRAGADEREFQALEAWDKLMMVILELLARAYGHEREPEAFGEPVAVDQGWVDRLANAAVAREQGDMETLGFRRIEVGPVTDIPDGDRKIVDVDGQSIGVFHHEGLWFAVDNSCIHQGGPVAEGPLAGDVLTCPWHGFQFNVRTGACITDPTGKLASYTVTVDDGVVYLDVPVRSQ